MAASEITDDQKRNSEIILIHFDVLEHHLPLNAFIVTAQSTEALVASFNERLFDGKLYFEMIVLPPEAGTFKSRLGIVVITGGILWNALDTDITKAFVKGLTGEEPSYWSQQAGERLRSAIQSVPTIISELSDDDRRSFDQVCLTEAIILAESAKSFLLKNTDELGTIGLTPHNFPNAFLAKNSFYSTCYDTQEINAVGFDDTTRSHTH